jgi:cell division septum initiation protein DivIVA
MDPATKLKRHSQLWSTGETSARRIGVGGAIFALVILLTVIEPYHIESAKTQKEIQAQQSEVEGLEAELNKIQDIQEQLGDLSQRIANQPWTDEIQTLKDDFTAGRVTEPGTHSNKALNAIAEELRKDIVAPLRNATDQLANGNQLATVPGELDKAITKWLRRYEQIEWWITRDLKDDTASAIGRELTWMLENASKDAARIKNEIAAAAKDMAEKVQEAQSEIDALLGELQAVMNRALPAWARGILDLKQLMVIYPWLLAGIAIYLIATAIQASRHFHAMADGEGWTAEERRDPVLSTAWTLTPRGPVGSVATVATYATVLGVLGLCVYRSQHPPESAKAGSVQAGVDIIAAQASWSALLAYGLFIAAIAVVATAAFRHR